MHFPLFKGDNSNLRCRRYLLNERIRALAIARILYRCLRTLFSLRSAHPSDRGTVKMISSCSASRIKVHGYGVVKEKKRRVW